MSVKTKVKVGVKGVGYKKGRGERLHRGFHFEECGFCLVEKAIYYTSAELPLLILVVHF